VLREGCWQTVRWERLQVGDICKVLNNQFFPADLVLLASRLVFWLLFHKKNQKLDTNKINLLRYNLLQHVTTCSHVHTIYEHRTLFVKYVYGDLINIFCMGIPINTKTFLLLKHRPTPTGTSWLLRESSRLSA
jgi:hypothetical protein